MKFTVLLSLAAVLATEVLSHSGHAPSGAALHRRMANNILTQRSIQRRYGAVLTKRKAARLARRTELGLRSFRRATDDLDDCDGDSSGSDTLATDTNITEGVCILTPEVTQGPYHILGELVRQNITQEQAGIPMEVDVDFIDVETCDPVPSVWLDAWHCNSTGYYSGNVASTGTAVSGGGGGGSLGGGGNMNEVPSGSQMSGMPSGSGGPPSGTDSANAATVTGAYSGADSAGSMLSRAPTDDSNFLRGAWQADADGHLTMYSIVPGWYSGRATHLHVKVYTSNNGSTADNGTFVAGSALHTGQLFFSDEFMASVGNTTPYNTNAVERLANGDDQWFAFENADGYDALMDIAQVSDDITDGVIASLVVGLNMSYSSPELTASWWAGDDGDDE